MHGCEDAAEPAGEDRRQKAEERPEGQRGAEAIDIQTAETRCEVGEAAHPRIR